MSNLKNIIIDTIKEIAEENELEINKEFQDETVLLDSGLDSLGFAILVSELQNKLGYDPFVLMAEPIYPTTFGEFVAVYDLFKGHSRRI